MGLGLNDHRRLFAVVFPPDDRLRQLHVDDARLFGVAQSEHGLARLNVVQRRHGPVEGRQPRPVVDVETAAVLIQRIIVLAHRRSLVRYAEASRPLRGCAPKVHPACALSHRRDFPRPTG